MGMIPSCSPSEPMTRTGEMRIWSLILVVWLAMMTSLVMLGLSD
jgi:hypothetical protein